ncbi:MAG: TetR/AcrR family transcriptional regulator [Thermomicrobiales bacterium]
MSGGGAAARRERGRQEMRAAILEAARRIVDAEGLGALSMRAIARDLDYSPAALYEYFAAKEEIARALYFEGAGGLKDRMQEALAAIPAGTPAVEAVRALGRTYRAYALDEPELFRLIFASELAGSTSDHEEPHDPRGGFDVLVEAMARAIAAGEMEPGPPELFALTAWSSVHGFVMLELGAFLPGQPGPARDALYDAHLQRILTGMLRR